MKVDIYWNRTRLCWSIREAGGKVIDHRRSATLKDARFIVQPGGRDSVRRTGKKVVHAWVRGELVPDGTAGHLVGNVRYNPQHNDTFVVQSDAEQPIHEAEYVVFLAGGKVHLGATA